MTRQTPDPGNLRKREEEFLWLAVNEGTVHHGERATEAGTEDPLHLVREWRDKRWCSAFLLLLIQSGSQPMGWYRPHSGWLTPLQLPLSRDFLGHAQRYVSSVKLDPSG